MNDIWTVTNETTSNNVLYWDNSGSITYWPQPNVSVHIPVEGAAKPEDPIEWLRRRVDEVCWLPA